MKATPARTSTAVPNLWRALEETAIAIAPTPTSGRSTMGMCTSSGWAGRPNRVVISTSRWLRSSARRQR